MKKKQDFVPKDFLAKTLNDFIFYASNSLQMLVKYYSTYPISNGI